MKRSECHLVRIPLQKHDRDKNGRQEHPQKCGCSRHHHEDPENRSGEPPRLFIPPFLQELRIHRNHGSAERPLSQKVLNHVWDLGRREPDVHQP